MIGTFEQQYEWSAHEIAAHKAGVDQKSIDAIKFNRGLDGLPEKDATLVRFGPDLLRKHKVDSACTPRSWKRSAGKA